MSRIPLFKPFPVQLARILGAYLILLVSVQAVLYLTIKDEPGIDYVPFNDPRWGLHAIEALSFGGLQYRYLTWSSVVIISIIAALNLSKPSMTWIKLYLIVESVFMLPTISATCMILTDTSHLFETLPNLGIIWSFALGTSLLPTGLAIYVLKYRGA